MIFIRPVNDNLAIFLYNDDMVEYEIIKHDRMKDMRIFINSIRMRSLHTHHDIELLLVIDGKGTIVMKGRKYHVTKGDTVLINAYDNHEIYSLDVLTVVILQFSNHFLNDYFHGLRNIVFTDLLPRDRFPEDEYRTLLKNILLLTDRYIEAKELFELDCVSILCQILSPLLKYLDSSGLSQAESNIRRKQIRRIDRISSYIDTHYQEPIRLSDLAQIENISTTHLSHFISENYGMTFQQYLNGKRLECALRLISDSSLTLSQVASDSGFSELKYMKKAFLDTFGMTPEQYRKESFIRLPIDKMTDTFEYIYSEQESAELLQRISIDLLLE